MLCPSRSWLCCCWFGGRVGPDAREEVAFNAICCCSGEGPPPPRRRRASGSPPPPPSTPRVRPPDPSPDPHHPRPAPHSARSQATRSAADQGRRPGPLGRRLAPTPLLAAVGRGQTQTHSPFLLLRRPRVSSTATASPGGRERLGGTGPSRTARSRLSCPPMMLRPSRRTSSAVRVAPSRSYPATTTRTHTRWCRIHSARRAAEVTPAC